jgi:small-conductance mechanosensitive channel
MLTTVFRRWDDHYTILPNQQLARREIRNMRRSGNAWMVYSFQVALGTPKVSGCLIFATTSRCCCADANTK